MRPRSITPAKSLRQKASAITSMEDIEKLLEIFIEENSRTLPLSTPSALVRPYMIYGKEVWTACYPSRSGLEIRVVGASANDACLAFDREWNKTGKRPPSEPDNHGWKSDLEGERFLDAHPLGHPASIFRPVIFRDGNGWIALFGPNPADGVMGTAPTPQEALEAFDLEWLTPLAFRNVLLESFK